MLRLLLLGIVAMSGVFSCEDTTPESTAGTEEMNLAEKMPTNGKEVVDLLIDKAATKASITNPEEKAKIREIFENTYTGLYGDLMAPISPSEVSERRQQIFFGSRDEIRALMKELRGADFRER
jgi:hypothetical protein